MKWAMMCIEDHTMTDKFCRLVELKVRRGFLFFCPCLHQVFIVCFECTILRLLLHTFNTFSHLPIKKIKILIPIVRHTWLTPSMFANLALVDGLISAIFLIVSLPHMAYLQKRKYSAYKGNIICSIIKYFSFHLSCKFNLI